MVDDRVEASLSTRSLGLNADPERIDVLLRRQVESEKINRLPPSQLFSKVLESKQKEAPKRELSLKEKKLRVLPKKGPKPQLLHSGMRKISGRKEDIIIKG